jgi:tRNA A-37 threonylcarbamoyl transferase component Bud32
MELVPPGFSRRAHAGASLVLRDDVADGLVAAGAAAPESLRTRASATYEGRGRPFGVDVPGAGRVFVRQYRHGGALRRITGELYRGDGRFLAELSALVDAAKAGVRVAEALGVVSAPGGLGLRRGWLFAREVPGAVDVLTFLVRRPPPARRRAVLESAGRAIRALFDAGFEHPDLHLKNLLLAPDGTVLVLDFDRVRRRRELTRERREAALFRFDRYAAKQAAAGLPVSRVDRMRVLKACAGSGWPRGEELRAVARRLARHVARHRAARR